MKVPIVSPEICGTFDNLFQFIKSLPVQNLVMIHQLSSVIYQVLQYLENQEEERYYFVKAISQCIVYNPDDILEPIEGTSFIESMLDELFQEKGQDVFNLFPPSLFDNITEDSKFIESIVISNEKTLENIKESSPLSNITSLACFVDEDITIPSIYSLVNVEKWCKIVVSFCNLEQKKNYTNLHPLVKEIIAEARSLFPTIKPLASLLDEKYRNNVFKNAENLQSTIQSFIELFKSKPITWSTSLSTLIPKFIDCICILYKQCQYAKASHIESTIESALKVLNADKINYEKLSMICLKV